MCLSELLLLSLVKLLIWCVVLRTFLVFLDALCGFEGECGGSTLTTIPCSCGAGKGGFCVKVVEIEDVVENEE